MHKNEKNLKSLSFYLSSENKENELQAALNKTEIELSKINKYLCNDHQILTNISLTQKPNNSSKYFREISPNNSVKARKKLLKNEKNEHRLSFYSSPRFNLSPDKIRNSYFKIIKPENKDEFKKQNLIGLPKQSSSLKTFTLNDNSKTQSSERNSKNTSKNEIAKDETPIHTFQMRGTPENSYKSQGSSNRKYEFIEVSNNNFGEISEIQMIENMELDSFKLNEKSTLKSNNLQDFNSNNINYDANEINATSNLIFLMDIEKERNLKLEEKLKRKDHLLNQMKHFHNELQATLKETQEELYRQNNLRSMSFNSLTINQQDKAFEKLTNENQRLKKQIIEKDLKMEAFLKEEKQKMKENSNDKNLVKKLNFQIRNLIQSKTELMGELEIFKQHQSLFQKQKKYFNSTLQENQLKIEDLNKEKEILLRKIENLVEMNKEKSILSKMDRISDEIFLEKNDNKLTQQFVNSLTNMMISISPDGYFNEKLNLKQIWKVLKKILEDYMHIKLELCEKNEIVQQIMKKFSTNNFNEILPIIDSFINEYDVMGKIINIFKKEAGIDQNNNDLYSLYEFIVKK